MRKLVIGALAVVVLVVIALAGMIGFGTAAAPPYLVDHIEMTTDARALPALIAAAGGGA